MGILESRLRESPRRRRRWGRQCCALLCVGVLLQSGCAIVYTDARTGATHLWGVGHLTLRATVPQDGKKAVVQGVSTCGIAAGVWQQSPFLSIGWERQQVVDIVDANTAVSIEGPDSDLLEIRVGSQVPGTETREGQP
jgi:hypothetical protein